MAEPVLTFEPHSTTISFNDAVLTEGKLLVCLLQLASSKPLVGADASRPAAVAAVQHLLVGGGPHQVAALADLAPDPEPVLIVAPEYAFGSADWAALDEAVRGYNRPLILLGGFGATPGQAIVDWSHTAVAEGDTHRHLAWDQAASPISNVRRINGGWCWVHRPGQDTHCFVFLKTVPEQNVEAVQLPDLQFGHTITHLRFDDLDIFPLICADLLQPMAGHPHSAQARIHQIVQTMDAGRASLVVGSLLQEGYSTYWEAAIDAFLNQVMVERKCLVALCNIAHDAPQAEEARDQWRSLTGIYGKWSDGNKGQANLPVGRRLAVRGVVGAVVRRTIPIAAIGRADWGPYGAVDGKFIWQTQMACRCELGGLAAPITIPVRPHGCEVVRFTRRYPAEGAWSNRVVDGLANVRSHIEGDETRGAHILQGLLNGVCQDAVDPDRLHEPLVQPALMNALGGLATLSTLDGHSWQLDESLTGQFRLDGLGATVLVWRDPSRTANHILRELGAWKLNPNPHPTLIVIAGTRYYDPPACVVGEERRDDIAQPPTAQLDFGATGSLAAEASDITNLQARRKVVVLGLGRLTQIYADPDPPGEAALIAQLSADIANLIEEVQ